LVKNRIGSPKNAAKDLGFTATIDLFEGLKKLINWRNNHILEVESRRKELKS